MEDQDELIIIIRKQECEELGLEVNSKAVLEDVGHNADLYIAIQEDSMQDQEPAYRRNFTIGYQKYYYYHQLIEAILSLFITITITITITIKHLVQRLVFP